MHLSGEYDDLSTIHHLEFKLLFREWSPSSLRTELPEFGKKIYTEIIQSTLLNKMKVYLPAGRANYFLISYFLLDSANTVSHTNNKMSLMKGK